MLGGICRMSDMLQRIIGEVVVGTVKWRVTLSHGLIQFWTDDGVDTANPRYVLSADIPAEVMDLAAVAARTYAVENRRGAATHASEITLEP